MRTSNPVLNERAFSGGGPALGHAPARPPSGLPGSAARPPSGLPGSGTVTAADRMTVEGVVYKTALLLVLCAAAAAVTWDTATPGGISPGLLLVTFLALLGTGIVTAFRPRIAVVTGPLYAIASGLFIGVVSSALEATYPGIAQQAALGTITTLGAVLVAYRTGLVRATPRFVKVVVSATMGVALLYLVSIGLRFFGMQMPLLHDSGPLGILVSVAIVGLAAMNLVLDFAFIERATAAGAEKRLEWFGAFGLLVTLVWLYLEILRLLSKLRD
jgi:uncharacterized YccA/Bax inhibitor family protein